nr:hypothetical protein C31C9.5 - Caenorhabditis elegans [Caenorhabditis elegans]
MSESIETSPIAHRTFILNDALLKLPIEESFKKFCDAFGDELMEYREFELWFYRFYNGNLDLNYDMSQEPKTPLLQDMPLEMIEEIMEHVNLFDRVALRNTSQLFRQISDKQFGNTAGIVISILDYSFTTARNFPSACSIEHNVSLSTNIIPDKWKKANAIMIPKPKKDPAIASSYRPISLLSPIAKLLEKAILKRIKNSIESPAHQHGFKPEHSTTTAVIQVTNDIIGGLNMKNPPERAIMACLDLRAAFDKVPTKKLCNDLMEAQGIEPKIKLWLGNYLHKRMIRTNHYNHWSKWHTLLGGVPQGSVISPNLFTFYLKDMPIQQDTMLISYADDTSIIARDKKIEKAAGKVQLHIDEIAKYLKERGMSISAEKSTVTVFSCDPKEHKTKPDIYWMDDPIPVTNAPKLLGITLNTMTGTKDHVGNVIKSMQNKTRVIKSMAGTNWGNDRETMLYTTQALIKPTALYGAPAWTSLLSDTNLEKLEIAYRSALRACVGLTKDTPTDHIYQECRVLPLKEEYKLATQQMYLAAIKSNTHPCRDLKAKRQLERTSKPPRIPPLKLSDSEKLRLDNIPGDKTEAQKKNHTKLVADFIRNAPNNKILNKPPPRVNYRDERTLPKETRCELARLRCGHSLLVEKYKARLEERQIKKCLNCGDEEGDVQHLLSCLQTPVPLEELWTSPLTVAAALGLPTKTPYDPGGGH